MSPTSDIYEQEPVKRSYMMEALIIVMLLLLLAVFFWDNIFINIPAGHKGVLFRTLAGGTVTDKYFDEGLIFIFPWNEMYVYDTRVISGQDTIDALTEDGLRVRAEISYRYRPNIDSLGNMHKNLGLDYDDKIIVPHVTAATRDVISRYRIDAHKAYITLAPVADVVIVGRSFNGWGGSDPIEPVALGKPTLIGPDHHNFADAVAKPAIVSR